ncbi:helix-turn-helix domain-containing protein [Epilithonimonas sp. UC225_85]|uniref:helix-turn-helix domain-containing protein n=1 Tax=Epilithonimonas sp. UC225_85 TaxID=3350167 RepID=UPI0036D2A436
MSLTNMAIIFNTNKTYLSMAIRRNKGKHYNVYINDLRLEYIITKLKTSPQYLNYKISYLAEECGYSSHTAFIRIFKAKKGFTPSQFIEFIKKGRAD